MVELERTLELYGVPDNWDAIAEFYLEAFEDVPADLVRLACRRLRLSPLRFFPKPGEIRALIAGELGARKLIHAKLQLAQRRLCRPAAEPPSPTEAEKARVDELCAAATRAIGGAPLVSSPAGHVPREAAKRPMSATDRMRVADELAGFRLLPPEDADVAARWRELGLLR